MPCPCMLVQQPALLSETAMVKHLTRHLTVVEINRAIPQNLGRFMTLARQEHNVTGTRLIQRNFNGAFAVRFHEKLCTSALQSDNRVVDNEQRVLAARIVGSQHDNVAQTARGLSH